MFMKVCTKCGQSKPATREFFGGTGTGSGSLRGNCRECAKRYAAEFEKNNKEKRKARDARRANTGENARKGFNLSTKEELFKKQKGFCLCCVELILDINDSQVDHCVPLSRGGLDEPFNYFLTHSRCNREKHNKTLREHWEWRLLYGLDTVNIGDKNGLMDLAHFIERRNFKSPGA